MLDKDCIDKLVLDNMRLVYACVKKYGKSSDEDLIQEGTVGLILAAQRFDPQTGNQFSTFAVPYIEGSMLKYVNLKKPVFRKPRKPLKKPLPTVDSLDRVVYKQMDGGGADVLLMDIIPHDFDLAEFMADYVDCERVLQCLNDEEWQLYIYLSSGYIQKDICELMGMSQPQVSFAVKALRAKVRNELAPK